MRTDGEKHGRKKDLQCHECEGFGHFKNECLLVRRRKLRYSECKVFGHIRSECPSAQKRKERSMICFSDTESDNDDEEEKLFIIFVALLFTGEEVT